MKVEIEIPDDALAVPLVLVQYVDRDARLQAVLTHRPETNVPVKDCLDLVDAVSRDARRRT